MIFMNGYIVYFLLHFTVPGTLSVAICKAEIHLKSTVCKRLTKINIRIYFTKGKKKRGHKNMVFFWGGGSIGGSNAEVHG